MAHVTAPPVRSHARAALVSVPWALLGRVVAGAVQAVGLAAVFWLLVALPGVLSARDSTAGHSRPPAATMAVARR